MTRAKIVEIKQQLQKPLAVGETWYLVDRRWYEQWKRYVNLDGSEDAVLDESSNPGPVDNLPILQAGKLKPALIENEDYVAVPESVWKYFIQTFGKSPNQESLYRKVINASADKEFPQLEIYPLDIILTLKGDPKRQRLNRSFSKMATLDDVLREFMKTFLVPSTTPLRVFECEEGGKLREIKESRDQTLDQLGIPNAAELCVQTAKKDGTFTSIDGRLSPSPSTSLVPVATSNVDKKTGLSSSQMASSKSYMGDGDASGSKVHQPGICGLNNLGNTCFMNSILQCLSNVPPLTHYFLENRYKDEINEDNPLGNGGEIAKAYAELIRALWSGQHSAFAPRQFKFQVGRFAPQFSGYQQHDSQELLTFLLDGLHEDLNRIKKKPYIELKDSDDRPDEVVAQEAWENYRKRNDSVIVDLFHGLLKSTVVCPECNKVSVTFDPFCTLSLPLPVKKERVIEVFLVRGDPALRPLRYRCTVPKAGTMKDLCEVVSKHSGLPWDELVVTDMYNHRFMRVYTPEDNLSLITERDITYVYQLPCKINDPSYLLLFVYNREKKKTTYGSPVTFGMPFVLALPRDEVTYCRLFEEMVSKMRRYVKNLDPDDERWKEIVHIDKTEKDTTVLSDGVENQTDSMEIEEPPAAAENGVIDENDVPRQPFHINEVNASASAVIAPLTNNGNPLELKSRSYISCDWPTVLREACYDSEEAATTEDDPVTNSAKVTAKRSSIYLKDCLELYTTVERLGADDAWYCPRCKKHQQATKKFDIWSLPDVLVIQLKRFSYNRWSRDKLDIHVDFPVKGLEMNHYVIQKNYRQSVYDLVCISNHYGGLGCGHYTAYGKNKDDNRWYLFDDSSVSSVSSEEQAVTKSAYVLFYVRRDPDSSHFNRPPISEASPSVADNVEEDDSMDQS